MDRKIPTYKEALKNKWGSIPGVSFRGPVPSVQREVPPVVKKKERKGKLVLHPGEMTTSSAAKMMGISTAGLRDVIISRDLISWELREVIEEGEFTFDKRYILQEKEVKELWKRLCKMKGVKRGTKLGSLAFLMHASKKEREKLRVKKEEEVFIWRRKFGSS